MTRWLFVLSLGVFLASRLIGLEKFPIFFLADEAVQTVRAADLLRDGGRDEFGQFLPVQFKNGESFNLGVSVYAFVLPTALLGPSVFVTRATAVVFALLATVAAALILRDFLRIRFWWAGVLVLSTIPGWFLHTRIAFGLLVAATFYVWGLYFYLRYRAGRRRAVFAALFFLALTCYTYTGFAPVVLATGVLLLVADASYHRRLGAMTLAAAGFLLLLALPYARFLRAHPGDLRSRLQAYGSYSVGAAPLSKKLFQFGKGYADALSPSYWLDPESGRDFVRHRMKGYGQIFWFTVPFAAGGLVLCAKRFGESAHRALLIALVAAPCGAALVGPGITRELTLVIVFALLATLALDWLLVRLPARIPASAAGVAVFLLLAGGQTAMLADALSDGPTWYRDYSMYGMQWGARQIFGTIRRGLEHDPGSRFYISPNWANGPDQLALFFFPEDRRVAIRHLDHYRSHWRELDENAVHVLTASEYDRVRENPRFVVSRVETDLPFPDGTPGFFFVRLRNPPDIEERVARENAERRRLVEEETVFGGASVRVRHSRFVAGRVADLFDGNPDTFVKFDELNPVVLELEFARPRPVTGIRLTTAGVEDLAASVELFAPAGPVRCEGEFRRLPADPTISVDCAAGGPVQRMRVELRDLGAGEVAYVHLRELALK